MGRVRAYHRQRGSEKDTRAKRWSPRSHGGAPNRGFGEGRAHPYGNATLKVVDAAAAGSLRGQGGVDGAGGIKSGLGGLAPHNPAHFPGVITGGSAGHQANGTLSGGARCPPVSVCAGLFQYKNGRRVELKTFHLDLRPPFRTNSAKNSFRTRYSWFGQIMTRLRNAVSYLHGRNLNVTSERVDDIPLLLAQVKKMGVPELLDRHLHTARELGRNQPGLDGSIWLAHLLSRGDHRLSWVEKWVEKR